MTKRLYHDDICEFACEAVANCEFVRCEIKLLNCTMTHCHLFDSVIEVKGRGTSVIAHCHLHSSGIECPLSH